MPARRAIAGALLALLLAACGDAPAPTADAFPDPAWAKVAREQIAEANRHGVPVAFENEIGMRFVLIPAGTFLMGVSSDDEAGLCRDLQHQVTLTRPFYVQTTEVTNLQYRRMRVAHSSGDHAGYEVDGDDQPVVRVAWEDARAFAAWLSEREECRDYALPSEAQWERACRAGTTSRFWFGEEIDKNGRTGNGQDLQAMEALDGESGEIWPQVDGFIVSAPVASFPPNAWGIHDMMGNVWEWCHDLFERASESPAVDPTGPVQGLGGMHIMRGGSYGDGVIDFRSGTRRGMYGFVKQPHIGFRLVSPLPEKVRKGP